jgi:hypothetical protein
MDLFKHLETALQTTAAQVRERSGTVLMSRGTCNCFMSASDLQYPLYKTQLGFQQLAHVACRWSMATSWRQSFPQAAQPRARSARH